MYPRIMDMREAADIAQTGCSQHETGRTISWLRRL